ncbi:unnamed protein product [Colias eurytheme]|nr:unnamed protein product [Colias eurytheme]
MRNKSSQGSLEIRGLLLTENNMCYAEPETASQRELRLTADRERHVLSCETESFTEGIYNVSQLIANGILYYPVRPKPSLRGNYVSQLITIVIFYLENSETFTQYEDRLTNNRVHHNIIRSLEDEHEHKQ